MSNIKSWWLSSHFNVIHEVYVGLTEVVDWSSYAFAITLHYA